MSKPTISYPNFEFRCWHKKRRKFYKVLHLHMEEEAWVTCLGKDIIEQKDIHIRIQPREGVITQYSGVNDRNDKKLFADDLVKVSKNIMRITFEQGVFYTKHKGSRYRVAGWDKDLLTWVGTYYENKDLLKEDPNDERSVATAAS